MVYKPISDYGVIGDMHTAALVARDGSIDWHGLSAPGEFKIIEGGVTMDFTVGPQDSVTFVLQPIPEEATELPGLTAGQGEAAFHETVGHWRDWVAACTYQGRWREMVIRSLLILKLLTYAPTGAILAAVTTSMPARIGGIRNWDYRHVWLRDAAFTLEAFMRMGYLGEARAFMRFLGARMREAGEDGSLQVMYGIRGEHELTEATLDYLKGLFERMLGYASSLGLYAEENGPTGDLLGNFPQAFAHLALINSAYILNQALDRGHVTPPR